MAYAYEIQRKPNYLRVVVDGERRRGGEAKDTFDVLKEVAKICEEENHNKMIFVWNVPGAVGSLDAFRVASNFEKADFKRTYKFATINYDKAQYESNRFTETVAVNRGWNFKVFNNEEDGLEWLLS